MGSDTRPLVSVVVASHRPDYVVDCVASFGDAVWGSVPTEVIVVADYDLADFPIRFPQARWVHHPDKSIPAKRNRGIQESRADIVGFIDDDCRPGESWVSLGAELLEHNPRAAGIEGQPQIECGLCNGPARGEFKRLESRGYRTNNIFYRRTALLDVGMFDERFTVQREDIDLAFSLLEHGYEIDYSERIRVTHRYRPNEKWDLLKNCINRRFDPLLHRKHPEWYRKQFRSPFTPSITILLLLHVAVCAGGLFRPVLWPWLGGLDIATTVFFTIRRTTTGSAHAAQWMRELAAYALSPVVLFAALVYGSVRFRTLLLF